MPVLDGSLPAAWPIWGKTVGTVCTEFGETPQPLPGEYKYISTVRLRINTQKPEDLFDRTEHQWGLVAGVLVIADGSSDEQNTIYDRMLRVLAKIQCEDAIYEKLGRFRLGLLLRSPEPWSQTTTSFAFKLEAEAKRQLKVSVDRHYASTSRGFLDMLRSIEWQMISDWANRRKAA